MFSADKAIVTFLQRQHMLSLAVTLHDGQPWVCNLFYAFDPNTMTLYFLSDAKTQHAQALLVHSEVAGTIAKAPKVIAKIQGIQFQGDAGLLSGDAAADAYARYYQAFPFARLLKAPIWQITLNKIKMTDNLVGFAHKRYWQRT